MKILKVKKKKKAKLKPILALKDIGELDFTIGILSSRSITNGYLMHQLGIY